MCVSLILNCKMSDPSLVLNKNLLANTDTPNGIAISTYCAVLTENITGHEKSPAVHSLCEDTEVDVRISHGSLGKCLLALDMSLICARCVDTVWQRDRGVGE